MTGVGWLLTDRAHRRSDQAWLVVGSPGQHGGGVVAQCEARGKGWTTRRSCEVGLAGARFARLARLLLR